MAISLLVREYQQEVREEMDRFLLFQEHQRLTQVVGAVLLITLVVQVVQVVVAQVAMPQRHHRQEMVEQIKVAAAVVQV